MSLLSNLSLILFSHTLINSTLDHRLREIVLPRLPQIGELPVQVPLLVPHQLELIGVLDQPTYGIYLVPDTVSLVSENAVDHLVDYLLEVALFNWLNVGLIGRASVDVEAEDGSAKCQKVGLWNLLVGGTEFNVERGLKHLAEHALVFGV